MASKSSSLRGDVAYFPDNVSIKLSHLRGVLHFTTNSKPPFSRDVAYFPILKRGQGGKIRKISYFWSTFLSEKSPFFGEKSVNI